MEAPMKRLTLTLGVAAMLAAASPAVAQVPLAEEAYINDSLRAGRIGDVIRNTCPTISARMFVVLMKIEDLKSYALDQGYSRDEVEAFIKNKDQKNRLKAEAAAYLAEAGAVEGDPESYCKVGRDEIAKGSLIGELLRSSE
jgi:Family of unknown function (DUF5333)